ncbi:MAG: glycosyltransferase family 4 protein [Armatimonadota bacterium]|nr:glycosyltransferase family 4 protein [Armatimonadota bacterium]
MKPRILFLAQLLPYPPVCGGTIRSFNILKRLCENYDVTLLSFTRRPDDLHNVDVLKNYCSDVRTTPITRSTTANAKWALRSLLLGSSFIIDRDYVPEMQTMVDNVIIDKPFDLVYVDHLQMSQYVKGAIGVPKVLDEHNVEWRIIQRIAQVSPPGPAKWFASIEWPKLRKHELIACREHDAVSVVTEHDLVTLCAENPSLDNINCVPIGVDTDEFKAVSLDPASKTILSVATMSWPPNIDAMLYFCSDIYPMVKRLVPGVRLVIAGANPPEAVTRLQSDPSISVPGFVKDIHGLASKSAVFIVPLRSGSGMRVKILNAMAMGLPVVSTSVGCEGIGAAHEKNVLLADNPLEFAEHTSRLLLDCNKRIDLGASGREFVIENYAWKVIYPRLDSMIGRLIEAA